MLDITSHLTAYLEWYFRVLLVSSPVTFGYSGHLVLICPINLGWILTYFETLMEPRSEALAQLS